MNEYIHYDSLKDIVEHCGFSLKKELRSVVCNGVQMNQWTPEYNGLKIYVILLTENHPLIHSTVHGLF